MANSQRWHPDDESRHAFNDGLIRHRVTVGTDDLPNETKEPGDSQSEPD